MLLLGNELLVYELVARIAAEEREGTEEAWGEGSEVGVGGHLRRGRLIGSRNGAEEEEGIRV